MYSTDGLDFGLDSDDELTWVLIREWRRDDMDPMMSTGFSHERFRLWTREEWFLYARMDMTAQRAAGPSTRPGARGQRGAF